MAVTVVKVETAARLQKAQTCPEEMAAQGVMAVPEEMAETAGTAAREMATGLVAPEATVGTGATRTVPSLEARVAMVARVVHRITALVAPEAAVV